jgi:nucleobase:cation symporter-1, NCS1 family
VDEALAETLPLTRAERRWSFVDVLSVKSGLAIATWAFLFGGTTAQYVGFRDGVLTMLAGNTIGVVILLLALVLPSSKWGTEFFVHQRSVYGPIGALGFVLVVVVGVVFAWAAILSTMIGKSAVAILELVAPSSAASASTTQLAVAVAMLAIAWVILMRGSASVRVLNRLAAPGLLLLCAWLMVALFSAIPLATLLAAAPIAPHPDRATNIMLVVELHIAGGISWGSLAANLGRYAQTQRAVVWGSLIAYVPIYVIAASVGLISALALGSADPVSWMIPITGPVAGALLLLLLGLANLSSLVGMVQGNCQTLIQHFGPRLQRLGWPRFTLLFFAGVATMVLLASEDTLRSILHARCVLRSDPRAPVRRRAGRSTRAAAQPARPARAVRRNNARCVRLLGPRELGRVRCAAVGLGGVSRAAEPARHDRQRAVHASVRERAGRRSGVRVACAVHAHGRHASGERRVRRLTGRHGGHGPQRKCGSFGNGGGRLRHSLTSHRRD